MTEGKKKWQFSNLTIQATEIVVETPDKFENSYFKNEYQHIFQVIAEILYTNDTWEQKKRENPKPYQPDIRLHNIVPIIGERGSGKSSIMHSVVGALKGYATYKEQYPKIFPFYRKGTEDTSFSFFCLDSIDGSLLEPNEDIFQTILAEMYMKLFDDRRRNNPEFLGDYTYESQKMNQRFENIYRNICKLQMMRTREGAAYMDDMSPLTSLKQLSSSLRLRDEFGKLVKAFLDWQEQINGGQKSCRRSAKSEKNYLVVVIDDLDLNIEHGYEMLETIHRYLMLPNVIVILCFDQVQFKRLSEHFFYRMIPSFDSRMNIAASQIGDLSRQYLDKVMPIDSRTYVPGWVNRPEIVVRIDCNRQDAVVGQKQERTEKEFAQKALIFRLLQQKLGMRMDTDGGKRHFFEQNSLRTFISFILMLNDMVPLAEQLPTYGGVQSSEANDQFLAAMQHNYGMMKSEIRKRMADERLSDGITGTKPGSGNMGEESYVKAEISFRNLFDQLINTSNYLSRAFRNLYSHVYRVGSEVKDPTYHALEHIAQTLGYHEDESASSVAYLGSTNRLAGLTGALDFYDYSYGEVLRIIYCYGRIDEEHKKLIHCLLAYFSLEMTRSYINYTYHSFLLRSGSSSKANDEKEKIKSVIRREKRNLYETLNGSVSGSWAGKMLPKIKKKVGSRDSSSGCVRTQVELSKVFWVNVPDLGGNKDSITKFIRSILVLGMFFDCPDYKKQPSFEWNLEPNESSNKEKIAQRAENVHVAVSFLNSSTPPLQNQNGTAVFNFMNFVTNAFRCANLSNAENAGNVKNGYMKLLDQIKQFLGTYSPNIGVEVLKNIVEEIKMDFADWGAYSGGLALPVYDVDLCYNLMKRLRQRAFNFQEEAVDPAELLNNYLIGSDEESTNGAYWFIARKLRNNDAAYRSESGINLFGFAEWKAARKKARKKGENHFVATAISFYDAFHECPYMKWIMKKEEYLSADFDDLFAQMVDKMLEKGNSKAYDDKVPLSLGYDD